MVVGLHVSTQASIAGAGQRYRCSTSSRDKEQAEEPENVFRERRFSLAPKLRVPTFANGRGEGGGAGAVELSVAEDPDRAIPSCPSPSTPSLAPLAGSAHSSSSPCPADLRGSFARQFAELSEHAGEEETSGGEEAGPSTRLGKSGEEASDRACWAQRRRGYVTLG